MAARALRAALALVLLALVGAAPASAEPGFEYEEVLPESGVRIGGFDSSAYDHGRFDGPLTAGKFVDPTGFAVDPVDNTVYVVDRTSSKAANPTDWRIQEIDPVTGEVLGTTTFTLPNEPSEGLGKPANESGIEGLAVDRQAGRLYALVVGPPLPSSLNSGIPAAQELLAWNTRPNAGKLEAAPGLPDDSGLHTTGALVSSEEQLSPAGVTPLYRPQGIAVDPLDVSGVDNPVAIEASEATRGYTIVQQIATTQGAELGDRLGHWSGTSVEHQTGGNLSPLGISTSPEGTLTVLLNAEEGVPSSASVYVVNLNATLSEATVLDGPANVPPRGDSDQSPMFGDEAPFSEATVQVTNPRGAGPQAVQLSAVTEDGPAAPYAAVFFSEETTDAQTSLTGPPGPEYWTSGEHSSEEYEANIGVRLLEPEASSTISDLQGRTIVNTLGNGARGGPCNIGAPEAALAAGAGGTLWILDRGPYTGAPEARGQGREIIELAPLSSGSKQCVKPKGTFTMTAPKSGQGASGTETETVSGEETLKISAGTTVTFNSELVKHKSGVGQPEGVNREGGKPFAYEWDLDGSMTGGPANDGFDKVYEMVPPHYYFPPSSITHTYTSPGEYKVRFRMRSDYGIYTPPNAGTVIVTKAPFHPEPRFTATPSGPDQMTFNANGSTPGVGKIIDYHWKWGDGGEEDEDPQTAFVTHTYAEPGNYQVTLTVTNSAYQSATSTPQTVTVVAPPPAKAAVLTGPLYAIPAPFALYPIPSVLPDRAPTRLVPHAHFTGGALNVTLACPATKRLCAGTISIETAAAIVAAKAGKSRHKAKKSRLLLGHAVFSIPGGQRRTVKVRLSAQGTALLERDRRLKTLLIVAAHDSLGDPATTTLALTLNAPAAHGSGSSGRDKHPKR